MGRAYPFAPGLSRKYGMQRTTRRSSSAATPKLPVGHGSTWTWSRSVMPRVASAAFHSGCSYRAMIALNDSSNRSAGRTPSCSTHSTMRPSGTATTISMTSACGPGTTVRWTRRSTARPDSWASTSDRVGSWSDTVTNRAASVSLPVAFAAVTATLTSSVVKASSGCDVTTAEHMTGTEHLTGASPPSRPAGTRRRAQRPAVDRRPTLRIEPSMSKGSEAWPWGHSRSRGRTC